MTDLELVTIILGRGHDGERAARALLASFRTLAAMAHASPRQLAREAGVTLQRARRLSAALALARRLDAATRARPAMRSPEDVAHRYYAMAHAHVEDVVVAALNARGAVLREWTIARGSTTWCAVTPRDVFAPLLQEGATHFVLVHAHPSGDPTPSAHDVAFTRRIVQLGELLGVRLRDHVIVAAQGSRSLAREGVVP